MALRFVLALLIARLYGPEGLGVYTLALAFATGAALIGVLGMDRASTRFVALHRARHESGAVVGLARFATAVTVLLSAALAAVLFVAAGRDRARLAPARAGRTCCGHGPRRPGDRAGGGLARRPARLPGRPPCFATGKGRYSRADGDRPLGGGRGGSLGRDCRRGCRCGGLRRDRRRGRRAALETSRRPIRSGAPLPASYVDSFCRAHVAGRRSAVRAPVDRPADGGPVPRRPPGWRLRERLTPGDAGGRSRCSPSTRSWVPLPRRCTARARPSDCA